MGEMMVLWKVEDEAERVLRERRGFRACLTELTARTGGTDIDDCELIYGELVGNAVRYAKGAVEARLEMADHEPPVLVVRDHGPGVASIVRRHEPLAESGRGLDIVARLARHLAVHAAEGGGTVVRATLPVTPRAPEPIGC